MRCARAKSISPSRNDVTRKARTTRIRSRSREDLRAHRDAAVERAPILVKRKLPEIDIVDAKSNAAASEVRVEQRHATPTLAPTPTVAPRRRSRASFATTLAPTPTPTSAPTRDALV